MTAPVPLALIQIIVLGIAAAVSPLPVMLSLAMQETKRPIANSFSYLAGGAFVYIFLALLGSAILSSFEQNLTKHSQPSHLTCALLILMGLMLLSLAYVAATSKREIHIPRRLDDSLAVIGPRGSFAIGLALCRPGWKNITLLVASFGVCAGNNLTAPETATAMVIFTALALSLAALPVIALIILPHARAEQLRVGARAWTERHALQLVAAVATLMGLALVVRGLSGLAS